MDDTYYKRRDRRIAAILTGLSAANVALAVLVNPWSAAFAGLFGVWAVERWSPRARRFLNRPLFKRGRDA